MEKQIKWSKRALKQLDDLYEYIKGDSPQNAEKVKDILINKINGLSLTPEIYPPDRFKKNNDDKSYRAFTVYDFRVSYYVTPNSIIIVRIRHTGMSPLNY